jgi:hypothetical protein
VNEGDESEGIWLINFIYINLNSETSCNCLKWAGSKSRREKW